MSQFRSAKYNEAMNAFLELNINPAKIVALYPESVSGRLSVPDDGWIHLFGGPASLEEGTVDKPGDNEPGDLKTSESGSEQQESGQSPRPPSPQGSIRGLLRTGLDSVRTVAKKEDELETASIKAKRKDCT